MNRLLTSVVVSMIALMPIGPALAQDSGLQIESLRGEYGTVSTINYNTFAGAPHVEAHSNPHNPDSLIWEQGVGSSQYILFSMNMHTGEQDWAHVDVVDWEEVDDGFVIALPRTGVIRTDTEDKILWTFPTTDDWIRHISILGETVVLESNLRLYSLELKTGVETWQVPIPMDSELTYAGDSLLIVKSILDSRNVITALDLNSGTEKWTFTELQVEVRPSEMIMIDHDGIGGGTVHNLANGKEVVSFSEARVLSVSRELFAISSLKPSGVSTIYERETGEKRMALPGRFIAIANDFALSIEQAGDGMVVGAFRLDSGERAWSFKMDSILDLMAYDGYLLVAGENGTALLDGDNGVVVEHRDDLEWDELGRLFTVVGHGVIVVRDHTVRMVDESGATSWTKGIPYPVISIDEAEGMVIVQTEQSLYGLDPERGDQRWHLELQSQRVTHKEGLLLVTGGRSLRAINPASGVQLWQVDLLESAQVITASDGMLHIEANRTFVVIDPRSGTILWQATAPDQIRAVWRHGDTVLLEAATSSEGGQVVLVGKN